VAQAPLPTPAPATGSSLPTLNVQSTPSTSRLTGPAHNPFAPSTGGTSGASGTSAAASTGLTAVTTAANNAVSALTGGSSTGSSGSTFPSTSPSTVSSPASSGASPTTTPPSITGNAKPKPAPTGLSSTQSYDVALTITNAEGGVNTVDPLERLSPVPSDQQPLLVELGVLQGGGRVLFAVQPGTVVSGPATCIPGPIDCEVISLGQDQTESISSAHSDENALFAITGISATGHPSAAAANKAREEKSAAGQAVLDGFSEPAVSLFKYEPSVGSVVDLRNLTVGG